MERARGVPSMAQSEGQHSTNASKFMTLGRQQHRFGRLSIIFDIDRRSRTLFVSVLAGRELLQGIPANGGLSYHVRVFMLPNQDLEAVERVLFKPRSSRHNSQFKKYSANHTATQTPILDEEFQFGLTPLLVAPQEFSIYIAVIANQPVASDGTGFVGCMCFPLLEVLQTFEDMPRWFWLLPKRTGLTHFESVQHHVLEYSGDNQPDVVIYGRSQALPNAFINGVYTHQPERHDGRSVYRMRKRNLVLYFHGPRGAWAIADQLGSAAPFAFADDVAPEPYDIVKPWCVFNKTREYRHMEQTTFTAAVDSHPGRFEVDPNVKSAIASEGAELLGPAFFEPRIPLPLKPFQPPVARNLPMAAGPQDHERSSGAPAINGHSSRPAMPPSSSAHTGALQPSFSEMSAATTTTNVSSPPPSTPMRSGLNLNAPAPVVKADRSAPFDKLLKLHRSVLACVEVIRTCGEALHSELDDAAKMAIFEDTEELYLVVKQMMAILDDLHRRDPSHRSNIGAGLRHASGLVDWPLATACQRRTRCVTAAKRLAPHLEKRMATALQQKHLSDETLVNSLERLPQLAVQYADILQDLLDLTPETAADHGTLSEAHATFQDLARRSQLPEPTIRARTNSILDANPLALEEDLSMVTLRSKPGRYSGDSSSGDLGGLGDLAQPKSPYEEMSTTASRRMSLAPDVDQDEDQLPVADSGRYAAVPQLADVAEQDEEDPQASAAPLQSVADVPPPPAFASASAHDTAATSSVAGGDPDAEPSWMHGDLTKAESDELLLNFNGGQRKNGRFLVRQRTGQPGDMVLTLMYKEKSTHHLIKLDGGDTVTINGKGYGGAKTLKELIKALAQPSTPGWPQPLTEFVPNARATSAQISADRRELGF